MKANSSNMELSFAPMIIRRLTFAALFTALVLGPAAAEDGAKHHAMSLIGEPKYPADFTHFDFVNPDAPKGGVVRLPSIGGF
nr:hypothetical protein [Desulfuromonadales bacterium]